jgi:serine/threonine protein kinase
MFCVITVYTVLNIIFALYYLKEPVPEDLFLYWMIELLAIAEKLQQCCIIHGDIKPDNFVLRTL